MYKIKNRVSAYWSMLFSRWENFKLTCNELSKEAFE